MDRSRRVPKQWGARIAGVSAAASVLLLASGCSSQGSAGGVATSTGQSNPAAANATTAVDPNAPLSLFEQRRLLNRIAADPRTQLQRLSPRERRGLAAMAAAANKKKADDEN
ncbi:MAG: hypothetical protein AB7G11_07685 [Phycisphaerales bacterium]